MAETHSLDGRRTGSPEIAVVGHILNERVIFPDRVLYPVLGSPVAYSSICLARLGKNVGIVTKIGNDFPKHLLEVFAQVGVRQEGVITTNTSTTNELIYHKDGHKTLKFLSRAAKIDYSDIPSNYLDSKIIYLCPIDYEIEGATIKRLSEKRRLMMVDLGGFGGATSEKHPPVKDGTELRHICPFFDVVKASIEDLEYILGIDPSDYKEATEMLLQFGVGTVVVTLGREGAFVSTAEKSMRFPAYLEDQQDVLDQTGAGDCFSAGFLSEFAVTQDPFEATLQGNVVTSFVIQRTGGASVTRMPTQEEVSRRAREMKARLASR
jgi:sugar/nucleoside kinase (ribokinase family)